MVSLGLVGRLPCSWFAACGSQLRSVAVCALASQLRIGLGRTHGMVEELVG